MAPSQRETTSRELGIADVGRGLSTTLHSKPDGTEQIFHRKNEAATGDQWCIVRLGRLVDPVRMVNITGLIRSFALRHGYFSMDMALKEDAVSTSLSYPEKYPLPFFLSGKSRRLVC